MRFTQELLLSVVLCFTLSGYAANLKANSEAFASHKILAEFKIAKYQGGPLILPVSFKGREYSFVLETGCSLTTFDVSLKHQLGDVKGLAKTPTGGEGMINIQLFDTPEALLGSLNLKDDGQVICLDHRMFSLITGCEISGALGMNFLKKYVVQIDFDKSRILFIQPTDSPNPNWGEELVITYGPQGLPYIKGTVIGNVNVSIKGNDVILSVQNKDTNKYDIWELRRLLMSGNKQEITMTIKHGNDIREVTFLLEKKI